MTPKFLARVVKGKLIFDDPEAFRNYILKFKNKVEVVVRYPRKSTSDEQRAYLFGVVYKIIGDYIGLTPEEVHYSKIMTELRMDYSKPIPTPKSVSRTGMSTKEFKEYVEKIQLWAAQELNLFIPDPDEVENE